MCVYPVGAEAVPDLDLTKRKFCFNIILPSSDEAKELRLYFDTVRSKEKKRESGGREEKEGREGGEKREIACSFYMYVCTVFFTSSPLLFLRLMNIHHGWLVVGWPLRVVH